jgi:hypothetical protein
MANSAKQRRMLQRERIVRPDEGEGGGKRDREEDRRIDHRAASVPKTGARHQLWRRSRLNTVTSSSCAVRNAAPEANGDAHQPAGGGLELDQAGLNSSGGTTIEQATASMKPTNTTRRAIPARGGGWQGR